MIRFQIKLEERTFKALQKLSKLECRQHRSQAVVLITEGLEKRGILAKPNPENCQEKADNHNHE
jgi:hypothetical protein